MGQVMPRESKAEMNIAISVNQPEPAVLLERRFGRCRYFLLVDPSSRDS
jgi:predicted Fe-Mo cluster-binding NifX family protein